MTGKIKRYFIAGFGIFIPIVITVYLLIAIFQFADGILGKFINKIIVRELGFYIPGLGLILCLILIFLIGFFATNFLGKKLFPLFERWLAKLPLLRSIYPAVKEVISFVISKDKPGFKKVVAVEYPRKGVFSIGFITNVAMKQMQDSLEEESYNVLIPSAPSPFTGFIIIVPKSELIFLDITVEEAIKLIASDGVVNPSDK